MCVCACVSEGERKKCAKISHFLCTEKIRGFAYNKSPKFQNRCMSGAEPLRGNELGDGGDGACPTACPSSLDEGHLKALLNLPGKRDLALTWIGAEPWVQVWGQAHRISPVLSEAVYQVAVEGFA